MADKPSDTITIRRAAPDDAHACAEALADVLIDCVEGGASVSFMHPLSRETALAFWRGVADGVRRGERVLLVAEDASKAIVGTVQLVLALPENQPHRADVAKMLVRRDVRRRSVGQRLMATAIQSRHQAVRDSRRAGSGRLRRVTATCSTRSRKTART